MDTPRKLFIGYDLCEDFTQISCYSYKTAQPVPIGARDEDVLNQIPTVLCVKEDTKQWLYGEEALACGAEGKGVVVEQLLEKLVQGAEVQIYEQDFSPVVLLEKYLRKTLMLVKQYFPAEQITKMVVTVRDTRPALVDLIYLALEQLGLERDRAVVMSHTGAYLYYALSQDKALWMNDVGLFEFNDEGLSYYQIKLNRRTKPMIACLHKTDYSSELNIKLLQKEQGNNAYIFENIANKALYKKLVTTLYFTGAGFNGDWADGVIQGLCTGRRVFTGQNLFTKGACYAARELSGDGLLEQFILLDDDMLTTIVGAKIYKDTKYQEEILAEAGECWFEVNRSIEVIVEGEPELELIMKNVMSKEIIRERIQLTGLPDRPDRMTRLEINLTCKNRSTAVLRVNDLGFGESYPETGCILETTIEI